MFTLDQLNEIHTRTGKQSSLSVYLRALNKIGVIRADSFLSDGHSEYYGDTGEKLVSPPEHEVFKISDTADEKWVNEHIENQYQGRITYLQMLKGLADSGIEKWTFDTNKMTMTYFDKQGQAILVESIP